MRLPLALGLGEIVTAPLNAAGDVVGGAASAVAETAVGALASAVADGVSKILVTLGTVWVKIGTPNVTTSDGTTASTPVAFIQSELWWFMAAAAVFAVILGGARMAWEQRADPGRDLLKGLFTLVVVTGCGLAVVSLAIAASDEFAAHIVDASTQGGDFGQNLTAMLGIASASSGGTLGPMLVIVLGLIAIFVSIVQIALMVVRAGMLVLLTGALPLAASFTSTEAGRMWFRRFTTWLIAFILYKPAAAIIYATAFKLAGSDVFEDDGLLKVLVGLALMIMSIFALPALLRFLAPMTSAVASGGGAGVGGAAAMLAAAGPTGAMALGRMPAMAGAGAGAGAAAGGGPSGATGAAGAGGGRGPSGPPAGGGASGAAGQDGAEGNGSGGSGGSGGEGSGLGTEARPSGGDRAAAPTAGGAGAAASPGGGQGTGGSPAAGTGGGAAAEGGASGASGGAAAAGGGPAAAGAAAAGAGQGAIRRLREEASADDDQEGGPDGARR
ncbi:MAG: hypothetical protein JSR84_00975 [Proteobacteria bacterium]|nr:hypothetical protein [Pseudomonadota bacterium]